MCIFFGLSGIFMGTVFSQLIQWFLKTKLFINVYLERSSREYICLFLKLILLTLIFSKVTFELCEIISIGNIYQNFAVKVLLCLILPNMVNIILFRNSVAFEYCCNTLMRLFWKLRKKI